MLANFNTMKTGLVCGALFASSQAVDVDQKAIGDDRRYKQLAAMMSHYNADFDERKYWAYGCHCFILGDRPMSDMGKGAPLDDLDKTCKQYKECLLCARMQYGDECIGEAVKYTYGTKKNEIVCKDNPARGSDSGCKRKLCECDAMFAKNHVGVKEVFDQDFHAFWSTLPDGGFDQDKYCVRHPGDFDPECCGSKTGPSILYNANRKECCNNKEPKEIGTC